MNTLTASPPRASSRTPQSLNVAQRDAVIHDDGPMLVVAGAGSGKTRVLTARVARLVQERGVRPDQILAVTFTNKAAGEMRTRIAELLSTDPRGLWIGTFHAVGARLLRRYADRVGRTAGFTIYDPDDSETLVKRMMDDVRASHKEWAPRAVASAISAAKNALVLPAEYGRLARDPFTKVVAAVYERFDDAVRRANAATFDDLLTLPVALLTEHDEIAASLSDRFKYVLVDEYQDTNHAQYQLVRRIARHGNVFVVGDEDQSIYGWRGADIRNILEFERDFPGARVVRLEENYRSRPEILHLANLIISGNTERREKTLRATRPAGNGVQLVTAADDRDEAEFIVDEILMRRAADRTLTYGSMAVLYRTNAQSRPLEEALQKRGIPYRLVGQVRFYERREIKTVIAWLRVVANPADGEAFRRAITEPRRGVGDGTVALLASEAARRGVTLLDVARGVDKLSVRGAARVGLEDFVRIVDRLRARAPELAVDELVRDMLDATGYLDWLGADGVEGEGEERVRNVEALIAGASGVRDELEGEAGLAPLDLFLQRIALVTSADESDAAAGAVTLMTLHNAKGLEFPVVFVSGLEDRLLPLIRSDGENAQGLEEERRLFYVGITRAEDQLYLTRAQRRWRNGETIPSMPSRFIRDLPPDAATSRKTLRASTAPAAFNTNWDRTESDWAAPAGGRRRLGTPIAWPDDDAPAFVDDESQDAPNYTVGERVRHARFGEGTIIQLSGQGQQAKARVEFDDDTIGQKTLMLAQAQLERGWE